MISVWDALNDALTRQGFAPATRNVVLRTGGCGALFVLVGIAGWAGDYAAARWILWFGVAALFSAWNFWALAKFVHQRISNNWNRSLAARLLLSTNLRLFITGIFVYISFVLAGAPLAALLGGLSLSLFFIIISGCSSRR